VVGEDAAFSLATIEDVERSAHAVMSEGQTLEGRPSVRLSRIERARVLLDNDGVLEQLVIVPGETAPTESAALELAPEERERRRDLARRLRELTDAGSDALGRGERGGLLAEGDVSAVYGEDGEMVGVQFDGIRAGGVYDRIGLRNGDVITDINGVSLGDPAAAARVLAQFASSDELVVSLSRNGSPETLRVATEAFERAVREFE
jgi:general secretion pathway protein C